MNERYPGPYADEFPGIFELLRDRGLVQGQYKQIFRAHNTNIRITLDN
jgi:hypothetical protein